MVTSDSDPAPPRARASSDETFEASRTSASTPARRAGRRSGHACRRVTCESAAPASQIAKEAAAAAASEPSTPTSRCRSADSPQPCGAGPGLGIWSASDMTPWMYVPSLAATPPNEIRSGPNHLAENYAASGSTAKRSTRWSAALASASTGRPSTPQRTRRPSSWPRTQIPVERPCRGCGGLDGVLGSCVLPGRRGGTWSRRRGPAWHVLAGRDV